MAEHTLTYEEASNALDKLTATALGIKSERDNLKALYIGKYKRVIALENVLRAIADDAEEFSHGDDNAQTFVRGFAKKARKALSQGEGDPE